MESRFSRCNKNITIYDERMLQIDKLDEWRTHVKEKLKEHDKELERRHNEHMNVLNQFKVGDNVLLDKTDPRISISELDANGSNPFTVLNIFPYGTVKVTHSEFDTFKTRKSHTSEWDFTWAWEKRKKPYTAKPHGRVRFHTGIGEAKGIIHG
ncbi:hypothetical protein GOBAR_AA11174 [Gossypium barbadense]|uniref:Uncharacterized protein n=1 Tax=Gossypium barbadense TaxID=3634 RepID=A0A2P5Y1I5_GOSBA|nr:hypothetical protein GOBAR_AA11174 [Gossypium barbadense]